MANEEFLNNEDEEEVEHMLPPGLETARPVASDPKSDEDETPIMLPPGIREICEDCD